MTSYILAVLAAIAGFQLVDLLVEIGTFFKLEDTYLRFCNFKPFNCDYCMSHWLGLILILFLGLDIQFWQLLVCWFAGARIGYFLTRDNILGV